MNSKTFIIIIWILLWVEGQGQDPDRRCTERRGRCLPVWSRCNGGIPRNRLCGYSSVPRQCCIPIATSVDLGCSKKGGTCMSNWWECKGQRHGNLCTGTSQCCFSQATSIDLGCSDRGGTCMSNWWECKGQRKDDLCVRTSQCCFNQGEQQSASSVSTTHDSNECQEKGGQCISIGDQCLGKPATAQCPLFETCCVPLDPQKIVPIQTVKKCSDNGGKCVYPGRCLGTVVEVQCDNLQQSCCVPRPQKIVPTQTVKKCSDEGGQCVYPGRCLGTVFEIQCDNLQQSCCVPRPQKIVPTQTVKKCSDEGGKCVYPGRCLGTVVEAQCDNFHQSCCVPQPQPPPAPEGKKCHEKGGQCIPITQTCFNLVINADCPLFEKCCIPTSATTPKQICQEKDGYCTQSWFCTGTRMGRCQGSLICCKQISGVGVGRPETNAEGRCQQSGGFCTEKWRCTGQHRSFSYLCGQNRNRVCCKIHGSDGGAPPTEPDVNACNAQGGKCLRFNNCRGRVTHHSCGRNSQYRCCLEDDQPHPSPEPVPISPVCAHRGGTCTHHCVGKVLHTPFSGGLNYFCPENMYCCLADPDKKCKDACGKCVEDTKCDGKIVIGLCGGDKVCCFKINKRTDAGCTALGGSNGVCMNIKCDGYFVKCNDHTQSAFCPDHKRMQCCWGKGKKPKPNSKDCKAAGGKCECNPCDGQFFPNTRGKKICAAGKKCCVIDPMKKCKDGGGKCQAKTVKCKGPYLSGFCGAGSNYCCFESDFTKSSPKGASEATAKGAGLDTDKFKGTAASEELAKEDVPHLNQLKAKINKVAAKTGIDAAIIAAIISRETRGGRAEHLKNPKSFGAMQFDGAKKRDDPLSEEHLQEATEHLISILREIFRKFPCWSMENKLKGAIAGYNIGGKSVKTIDGMDKGTTGDDYSGDVVARAKWLRANGHF